MSVPSNENKVSTNATTAVTVAPAVTTSTWRGTSGSIHWPETIIVDLHTSIGLDPRFALFSSVRLRSIRFTGFLHPANCGFLAVGLSPTKLKCFLGELGNLPGTTFITAASQQSTPLAWEYKCTLPYEHELKHIATANPTPFLHIMSWNPPDDKVPYTEAQTNSRGKTENVTMHHIAATYTCHYEVTCSGIGAPLY